jgi:hypothetical protein
MPKFVIERQYLAPTIQHVIVEADDLAAACQKVVEEEGDLDDWDDSWEGEHRDTTITHAKLVPDGYDLNAPTTDDPDGRHWKPLTRFLYSDDTGPMLDIPDEHVSD